MLNASDSTIDSLEADASEILRRLQVRTAKRPVIIEFSGSPKSGKTTAIGALSLFFRRNNFSVEVFTERASISPVANRGSQPDFNVWVSCASLEGLIESMEKNIDLFFVDRGLFDALVWNRLLARIGRITPQEAETIEAFFAMDRWIRMVDLVCVLKCDPATSIARKYTNQLTRKRSTDAESSILDKLNLSIDDTLTRSAPKFKRTIMMDTTNIDPGPAAIEIAQRTLGSLRQIVD